jgi:hypothetical protein
VDSFPGFRQHRLRQYSNSSRLSARNDARGWIHHEAPRAAKPQPKSNTNFTTKDAKSTKEKMNLTAKTCPELSRRNAKDKKYFFVTFVRSVVRKYFVGRV